MAAKTQAIRIKGNVPESYTGPVYYRLSADLNAPWDPRPAFRLDESKERIARLLGPENSWMSIRTSGVLLDSEGRLTSEWNKPLKGRFLPGRSERLELVVGDPALWISERVHDAIVSLEPDRHLFLPIDITGDDGRRERRYAMFPLSTLHDPPAIHPRRNGLTKKRYISGKVGHDTPDWAQKHMGDERFHFGYLDADVVGGLHCFQAAHLDNALVFSPELFAKLQPFGDILQTLYDVVPIGVSSPDDDRLPDLPDPPPWRPPETQPKGGWSWLRHRLR